LLPSQSRETLHPSVAAMQTLWEIGGALRFFIPVLAFLLAASALAQVPPAPPPPEQPEQPEGAQPEYSGPVILSRGSGPSITRSRELLRLRPFLQVSGTYDTGLTAVSVTPQGEVLDQDAYGAQASFGVSGFHSWRRSLLGLNYRGNLRHYSRNSYHDGFDNFFSLNFVHQPSRRLVFSLSPSLASYSYSYGGVLPMTGSYAYDPDLAGLTQDQLFDNRTNLVTAAGRLVYLASPRLSFGIGGTGFAVRRRSRALVGVQGYQAVGDVAYRLSRFQTLGVDYSFHHYDFTNYFGSADMHGVALNYSVQMGRYWTLRFRGGGYRLELVALQRVPLDPVIAAIIGQRAAVSVFYKVSYLPNFEADLTRTFRRASLSFHYLRSVSPGNGVYLTSGGESGGASYHYSGIRRVSLGATASYHTYRALMQNLGKYHAYQAGGSAGFKLRRSLSLTASAHARRYELRGTGFNRVSYGFAVGLGFHPGEIPFSIW
jgi:hypothetical protein